MFIGNCLIQISPSFHHHVGLILVPVQLSSQLWPPAGDVPHSVIQLLVNQALRRDCSTISVSNQPHCLVPDPLWLLARLIRTNIKTLSWNLHLLKKGFFLLQEFKDFLEIIISKSLVMFWENVVLLNLINNSKIWHS